MGVQASTRVVMAGPDPAIYPGTIGPARMEYAWTGVDGRLKAGHDTGGRRWNVPVQRAGSTCQFNVPVQLANSTCVEPRPPPREMRGLKPSKPERQCSAVPSSVIRCISRRSPW